MRCPAYRTVCVVLSAALIVGPLPCYAYAQDTNEGAAYGQDAGALAESGVSAVAQEAATETDYAEVGYSDSGSDAAVGGSDADTEYAYSDIEVGTDEDGNAVITYPDTDVSGETVKETDGCNAGFVVDDEIDIMPLGRSNSTNAGSSGSGGGSFSGGGRGGGSFSGGSTVLSSVNSGFSAMVTGLANIASNTYGIGSLLKYVNDNMYAVVSNTRNIVGNTFDSSLSLDMIESYTRSTSNAIAAHSYDNYSNLLQSRSALESIYKALTKSYEWSGFEAPPLASIVGCYVMLKGINEYSANLKALTNVVEWNGFKSDPLSAVVGCYVALKESNTWADRLYRFITADVTWSGYTSNPFNSLVGSYVMLKGINENTANLKALTNVVEWNGFKSDPLSAVVGCYVALKQLVSNGFSIDSSAITDKLGEIIKAINDKKIDASFDTSAITDKLGEVIKAINDKKIDASFDTSAITDKLGEVIKAINDKDVKVSVQNDVTNDADSSATFWGALVGAIDLAKLALKLDTLGDTLKSSFPFGLVFFLVSTLSVFSASAVTPSWSGELMGTAFNITLKDFDGLAALFRALVLGLYVFGLYSGTKNWLYGGADD